MSKKHVDKYFLQICNDYKEMLDVLKETTEMFEKNIVSEEKLNEIKNMVEPLKENYMRWSYMMYLLNKPNKKEKRFSYQRQNKEQFKNAIECEKIEKIENDNTIKELKSLK